MERVLVLLALIAFGFSPVTVAAVQDCTTTLKICTCGQAPVTDHKVKIEIRDGGKIKERTDGEGKIVLDVCCEDISEVKVSGIPASKISRTTVFENTDTEELATITLNVCDA